LIVHNFIKVQTPPTIAIAITITITITITTISTSAWL
jgi:hypothetical protein